jgi:UDP-3-O-[3-hydroxymyristoyl] glucosamine N-acyltransferase
MFKERKTNISVKKIAEFLKREYEGENFDVTCVSSMNDIRNNSLLFYSELTNVKFKIKDNVEYDFKKLDEYQDIVLITTDDIAKKINIPVISSKNPRLDFQRVIMEFFSDDEFKSGIHSSVTLESNVKIGKNVYVGPNCYIGKDVVLGDNTKILSNTVIFGVTEIGKNCVISSNCTIGSEGFSFSYDEKGFVHFNHIGGILIGDNVWIGSNCTVEKSQLDQTIIEDDVKIDDLVHISHNTVIKKFSQITVGAIICGRAKIGKDCWIAPNAVIDTGCQIGNNCFVGISSVVRNNFPDNCVVVGTPAKLLRKNK